MAQHTKNTWSGIGYINHRLENSSNMVHAILKHITVRSAVDVLLAALLTQAVLPGGAMLFAVPFMAAILLLQKSGIPALIGCTMGLLLRWEPITWVNGWQLSACVLLMITVRKGWDWKPWKVSLAAGAAMLLPLPFVARQMDTLIICLSGGIAAGLLTPVFIRALLVLDDSRQTMPNQSMTNDDRLCCLLIASILSLGGLSLQVQSISIGIAIASFTVYIVAWTAGSGLSLPAGVLMGLILMTSGSSLDIVTMLAVLGGMAGMLRDTKRYMPYIAALFACALAAFAQGGLEQVALLSPSIALGGFCFLVMPRGWLAAVGKVLDTAVHVMVKPDASVSSFVLGTCAQAMAGMAQALPTPEQNTDTQPIELLACRLCTGCEQQQLCWDERRELTMTLLDEVLLACAGKANLLEIEQAAHQYNCSRASELYGLATGLLASRIRKEKENARRLEARAWALEHLRGQARALSSLAERIAEDGTQSMQAKSALCAAIPSLRSNPDALTVHMLDGKLHVWLDASSSDMQAERFTATLSAILEKPMEWLEAQSSRKTMLFVERPRLFVSIGRAGTPISSEEISGDSALSERLDAGKHLLAISDGMGSGREANSESKAALELLLHALRASYSRSDAIRTVNGLLVACRGDEMFATMDLCVIDLDSGEAALDKLGACPSFIIRGGKCKRIGSDSLPMGILEAIKPRALAVRMQPGDILLMISDGVMDAFGDDENSFLRALGGLAPGDFAPNPQHLADTLLRRAYERSGGTALDDMTVLAARIEVA